MLLIRWQLSFVEFSYNFTGVKMLLTIYVFGSYDSVKTGTRDAS